MTSETIGQIVGASLVLIKLLHQDYIARRVANEQKKTANERAAKLNEISSAVNGGLENALKAVARLTAEKSAASGSAADAVEAAKAQIVLENHQNGLEAKKLK